MVDLTQTLHTPERNPNARNVSNSEVTCFLTCKRMYEYAFMQELAPKVTPDPLARGSVGHHFFELYWKGRMDGMNHQRAIEYGLTAFANPMENTTIDVLMNAQFLVMRYMQAHEDLYVNRWKPLGAEQQYDLPLTSSLNMTIKYDLYLEDMQTGKKYILDYKFSYDFWSPADHDLNGQMPKYIAVMQANGFKVDGGYLEEIRSRKLGEEKSRDPKNLWRRTPYVPSIARKQSVLRQHIAASLEIEKHRSLPPEERRLTALPVLNKHGACKYCNFKDLCNSEIEGKTDLSVDIRTGYTQSTYGYNKDKELDF